MIFSEISIKNIPNFIFLLSFFIYIYCSISAPIYLYIYCYTLQLEDFRAKKMRLDKIKSSIRQLFIIIGWLLIPIFQYIPCASIWYGIMSLPLIGYLSIFFTNPTIVLYDFDFFIGYGYPWSFIAIGGAVFFLLTLVYQLVNRKKLIMKGPYKYSRHPQYLAIIIMTFSLTMISLNTSPIYPFISNYLYRKDILVLIWILEVIAYVLLAKLEEFWLIKKYGEKYIRYQQSISFMLPFMKRKAISRDL